jgi:hypothetical protein
MGQAKSIDRIYSVQRLICPRFPPECCLGRYLLRDFGRGLQSRFMLCYILESQGLLNTGYGLLVTGYDMFLEVSTYVRRTDVERFGILHKNLRLLFCVGSFCYCCYRSKYIKQILSILKIILWLKKHPTDGVVEVLTVDKNTK